MLTLAEEGQAVILQPGEGVARSLGGCDDGRSLSVFGRGYPGLVICLSHHGHGEALSDVDAP